MLVIIINCCVMFIDFSFHFGVEKATLTQILRKPHSDRLRLILCFGVVVRPERVFDVPSSDFVI